MPTTTKQHWLNLFLCAIVLCVLSACEEKGEYIPTGPTPTPIPVQIIENLHESSVSESGTGIVAAAAAPDGRVFAVLKGQGLRIGTANEQGKYAWSRASSMPEALLGDEISTLVVHTSELWIGTRSSGLYVLALGGDIGEWRNYTTENSELPSNTINRFTLNDFEHVLGVVTTQGIVHWQDKKKKFTIWPLEGLTSHNILDEGFWQTYAGGGHIVITDQGIFQFATGDKKFSTLYSPGYGCRFDHSSRIHTISAFVWVVTDAGTPSSETGSTTTHICEGYAGLFGLQWNAIDLRGLGLPTPHIVSQMMEQPVRLWFTIAPDDTNPQGAIVRHDNQGWTRYQLPELFSPVTQYDAMVVVGRDLWLGSVDRPVFTVLENALPAETTQAK